MPKVNLSNYGPLGHRKTVENADTLLEKLSRLLARIGPGVADDVLHLKNSIITGNYCLNQLKAPERSFGLSTTPHTAYIFSMDADYLEEYIDDLRLFENPSANLAALGDSFVPEVRSALLQVVAILRRKQSEYEAMEAAATGGRRKTRSARKHGSRRKTRNARKPRSNRKTRNRV